MKSQTDFANLMRQIAHEIKNPLYLIGGNIEVISDLMNVHGKVVQKSLTSVGTAVARIDRIVNSMMKYGDSLKGYSPTEFQIEKLLLDVVDLSKGACKTKGISISVDCTNSLYVLCDEARVGQALINLVVNAIQYTLAGGQIIVAAAEAEGKLGRNINFVRISVTDTGIGIPKDKLESIFLPSITSKQSHHNYGLGLAMVYQTVVESNGHVEVQSEVGKGTTFNIYLPVASVSDRKY